jgi:hypothetical protein
MNAWKTMQAQFIFLLRLEMKGICLWMRFAKSSTIFLMLMKKWVMRACIQSMKDPKDSFNYCYSSTSKRDSTIPIVLAAYSILLVVHYSLEVFLSTKLWLFTTDLARGKKQKYRFFNHLNLDICIKESLKKLMLKKQIKKKNNLFSFQII